MQRHVGFLLVCLSIACSSEDEALAPPAGVDASDGGSPTHVTVRWQPAPGATAYRVFRDGALVGEVAATQISDGDASGPSLSTAPIATATEGTANDRVIVQWSPSTTDAGTVHAYTVTAVYAAGESEPSAADEGHRGAAPIFAYEISIDGGPFSAVGQMTRFDDTAAPAGAIVTGYAASTQGTIATHVALAIQCVPQANQACHAGPSRTVPGAPRTYQVRAITAAGASPASSVVTGFRGIGPLVVQWERSAQDADTDYAPIADGTTESYADTGAPATSEARFYRCRLTADGAPSVLTNAVRGWRALASVLRSDAWIPNPL